MSNKREYKNAALTKSKIRYAVIDCLREQPDTSKLTISLICEKAEINRGTFYNHYANVHEVLVDISEQAVQAFQAFIDERMTPNMTKEEKIKTYYEVIAEYFKDFQAIFFDLPKPVGLSFFEQVLQNMTETYKALIVKELNQKDSSTLEAQATIIAYGILAAFLKCFKGELKPEDVAKAANDLVLMAKQKDN